MKTEQEQFDENVWYVLNQIKVSKRLGSLFSDVKGVPYVTSAGKNNVPLSDVDEVVVINYLVGQGVISIIEGPGTMEIGKEWEEKTRFGGFTFALKLLDKFDDFFDKYRAKYATNETLYKLVINQDTAEVRYQTPDGLYKTKFRKHDATFKLLSFMVKDPHKTFTLLELCNKIDERENGTRTTSSDERRIRDLLKLIRKKLKLFEKKNDNKLFLVDNKNFGLNCDVEIRE